MNVAEQLKLPPPVWVPAEEPEPHTCIRRMIRRSRERMRVEREQLPLLAWSPPPTVRPGPTADFEAQRRWWYSLARARGFQDIEAEDNPDGPLDGHAFGHLRDRARPFANARMREGERFFYYLRRSLHVAGWLRNDAERYVVEQTLAGVGTRTIALELRMRKQTVQAIVRRAVACGLAEDRRAEDEEARET